MITILAIEDNLELATLIELSLVAQGYAVETTSSGLSGLLRFNDEVFDIVLLDMQIEDLSGPGAHRAIRDICPPLRQGSCPLAGGA
jgi:DNA-binding response OmpR family regulator